MSPGRDAGTGGDGEARVGFRLCAGRGLSKAREWPRKKRPTLRSFRRRRLLRPLPMPDPAAPTPAPQDAVDAAAGDAAATAPEAADDGSPREPGRGVPLLAAGLAWLFPGLGHLVLGRTRRGLVLAVAITSLYLAGLLIGGVAVVDRRDHPAWFLSQALIAPSFVFDRFHQNVRDAAARAGARQTDARADAPVADGGYAPAFGRAQEQGTLYTAAAGLLNLLAMLDAASRRPGHERRASERRTDAAPMATATPEGATA